MRLLKNKRAWLKFLRDDVGMYCDPVKQGKDHAAPEKMPEFPCYGYTEVVSWNYEERRPIYLHGTQIFKMWRALVKDVA